MSAGNGSDPLAQSSDTRSGSWGAGSLGGSIAFTGDRDDEEEEDPEAGDIDAVETEGV